MPETGEVLRKLRALVVLPKDQVQYKASSLWPTAILNSSSSGFDAFWFHGHQACT